ncbi:AraC family transcriptional regulator [Calycomorphotria hydatis]|uniref:Xylose operon regulatory protein n=1 Tax=Calycomorphotria hydatis TaxID=2528027 RepID=A0A517TEJ6_9PLAN|nr:DNA-binding transcriptional regulator [Calycomorphotria hydatis]QDT66797.1 Xylose operon regulatory protein [Calycomorphotria hydatis]
MRHYGNDLRHSFAGTSSIEMRTKRKNVALIIESSRSYGRDLLRGVAQFSRTLGNWSLLHEEMSFDDAPPGWLAKSQIDGMIVRLTDRNIEPLKGLNIPIIDVRCHQAYTGIPQVDTDDSVVAQLAFQHLWQQGFRRFAYCGYRGVHYSEVRLQHFEQMVAASHCPLTVYRTEGKQAQTVSGIERSGLLDVKPLSNWLTNLEPPTGLFVCNDIRGQQVLNVCRKLELSVPDDLAVIGVDDDDTICPLSDPPLSSVQPNAEQVGYRASEILHQMMNGKSHHSKIEYVQPSGVTQRQSTQVIAVEDREVARVCRFIREYSSEGINVGDVVKFSTLSRRQLERRFREELNCTPHEELMRVQIARVKQLLMETELTLDQLAPLAGYSHKERLSAVFKRETGETPGEFRRRVKSPYSQGKHNS